MLIGIHYMRGLAALLVVIFHAIGIMVAYDHYETQFPYYILAAGVDIFFVISGYLMVKTTEKYKNTKLDWKLFLYKRLTRIAPMYWLITILISIAILYKPSLAEKQVGIEIILKSLLFIPTNIPGSHAQSTVIPVGWTLVYEMFFYFAFAAFTAFNYRFGLSLLIITFCALSLTHSISNNYYLTIYSNPIILEFILGILVAKLKTPTHSKGLTFALLGCLAFFAGTYLDGPELSARPISAGIGAALMIYGASGIELKRKLIIPSILGDASYSIYLTHNYIIKAGVKILPPTLLSCLALIATSILAGYAIYKIIEKPMQALTSKTKPKTDLALTTRI
jgi:peptidoglycan/LPS O-acetylase OafA/YrhL